jgi:hypothetical protein
VALETFNYLDSLVPTNPVVSDGLVNGDDHIRGIKSTLKATFPNVTGPITATHTAINAAAAAIAAGVSLLDHSHAYNSDTSGLNFVSSTVMDLVVGGQTPVRFTSTDRSAAFAGPVSAHRLHRPRMRPHRRYGHVALEDSPAQSASGVVVLGQRWHALAYRKRRCAIRAAGAPPTGAGDGSTTFNVINMQEVVPCWSGARWAAHTSPRLHLQLDQDWPDCCTQRRRVRCCQSAHAWSGRTFRLSTSHVSGR